VQQSEVIAPALARDLPGDDAADVRFLEIHAIKAFLPVLRCWLVMYRFGTELFRGCLIRGGLCRWIIVRGEGRTGGYGTAGQGKSSFQDPSPRCFLASSWHFNHSLHRLQQHPGQTDDGG
jgi:hypothetical protein